MADFTLKQDDTDTMRLVLEDAYGPIDLRAGGDAEVRLYARLATGAGPLVEVAVLLLQQGTGAPAVDKGLVEVAFTPAATAVAGVYRAEFLIVFPLGTRRTVPDDGWLDMVVVERVGPPPVAI